MERIPKLCLSYLLNFITNLRVFRNIDFNNLRDCGSILLFFFWLSKVCRCRIGRDVEDFLCGVRGLGCSSVIGHVLSNYVKLFLECKFLFYLGLYFLVELLYCLGLLFSFPTFFNFSPIRILVLFMVLGNFVFDVVVDFLEELDHFVVQHVWGFSYFLVLPLIDLREDLQQVCDVRIIIFSLKNRVGFLPGVRFLLDHLILWRMISVWWARRQLDHLVLLPERIISRIVISIHSNFWVFSSSWCPATIL